MRRGRPKRQPPKKPKQLNPRIVVMRNELGEIKYRVFRNGVYLTRGISLPAISKDFDTQREAERYYHDNFGWDTLREYQPEANAIPPAPRPPRQPDPKLIGRLEGDDAQR